MLHQDEVADCADSQRRSRNVFSIFVRQFPKPRRCCTRPARCSLVGLHISTWYLAVTSILFGAHREVHPRGQMVTIFAFQAKDPGSIPGGDKNFFFLFFGTNFHFFTRIIKISSSGYPHPDYRWRPAVHSLRGPAISYPTALKWPRTC